MILGIVKKVDVEYYITKLLDNFLSKAKSFNICHELKAKRHLLMWGKAGDGCLVITTKTIHRKFCHPQIIKSINFEIAFQFSHFFRCLPQGFFDR